MGLIRRENGYYYILSTSKQNPIKLSLRTKDYRTALELYGVYLKERVSNLIKSRVEAQPPKTIAVKKSKSKPKEKGLWQIWDGYYQTKEVERLSYSQMTIKKQVRNHLKRFGFSKISDFNQPKLNEVFEFYKKQYKDDSIHKFMAEIKCFLNYLVRQGILKVEAIKRLTFLKTVRKVRDTVISDEDAQRILAHLKEKDFDFYLFILSLTYLYGRPNEIPSLQVKNFNFPANNCRVYMNKTKKWKTVVLKREYAEFMKGYIAKNNLKAYDYLFVGYSKGKEFYSKKFSKLKETLNLNPDYTLYTYRHTGGTAIYRDTHDVKFGASQLGDCEDVYIRTYVNMNHTDFQKYT